MAFPTTGMVTVYTNQVPFESDVLRSNSYRMAAISKLAQTLLGTGINNVDLFNGLPCSPVAPPGLQVVVGVGVGYSFENYADTDYGVLPADTNPNHKLYKQGISLDPVTLNTPAPVGSGNSVIHLVQARFRTQDVNVVTRPYFNSADPTDPLFNDMSDTRIDDLSITIKLGTEGPSPSPPSPDSGYTGLYYVTVAFGQTVIVPGDITTVPDAPFITESLTQKVGYPALRNATYTAFEDESVTPNSVVVNPAIPYVEYVFGTTITVLIANTNTGASNIDINGIGSAAITVGGTALTGGEMPANWVATLQHDGTSFQLLNPFVLFSPTKYAFVIRTTNQTISGATPTKVQFDSVVTDVNNFYDTGNFRFTPGVLGVYSISTVLGFTTGTTQNIAIHVYKNGSDFQVLFDDTVTATATHAFGGIPFLVEVDDVADYFEIFVVSSAATFTVLANTSISQFKYEGTLP